MPFKPVFLPTDVLLWLLLATFAGYAWYCHRKPHLAVPWRRVFRSRMAVGASVVLACYLAVGFADSLHYRERLPQSAPDAAAAYGPELSVLDLVLTHLREKRERTYS